MKKLFTAIAAVSLLCAHAMATEVKFATEATYPPFEFMTDKMNLPGLISNWHKRFVLKPS